jgi:hypothetical protein
MRTRVAAVLIVAAGLAASVAGQNLDPGPVFRVFLKNGQALASYGEVAQLDGRVMFTLIVGDGSAPGTQYQLINLPAGSIDLERTLRYRDAVRAARYAATRGETDYTAMTAEVSRAIDELSKVSDPKERLAMAEEARRRLLAWSRENYGYRAKDIQELAGLFDDVIASLRAAAGESQFTVDFVAGRAEPVLEPLRPQPTLRESINLVLAAVMASDVAADRVAMLNAAAAALNAANDPDGLRTEVNRLIETERTIDDAYSALAATVRTRASRAAERGDVPAVRALQAEVAARDRALGERRPVQVESLLSELDVTLEHARVRRLAIEHYAMMRPRLLAYERDVRLIVVTLDGAKPGLDAIREMSGPGIYWLEKVDANLNRAHTQLKAVNVPDELADIHATLSSALRMAMDACRRRRTAMAANDIIIAREASSAAAGAILLAKEARSQLLARLYPPKIQ